MLCFWLRRASCPTARDAAVSRYVARREDPYLALERLRAQSEIQKLDPLAFDPEDDDDDDEGGLGGFERSQAVSAAAAISAAAIAGVEPAAATTPSTVMTDGRGL